MENTIFLFSCLDEKQRDLFVVLPEILICGNMRKLFDKVTRLRILDRKILTLDRKTDAPVIPPPAAHLGAQATAAAHGGTAAVHDLDHALADGGGAADRCGRGARLPRVQPRHRSKGRLAHQRKRGAGIGRSGHREPGAQRLPQPPSPKLPSR